MSTGSLINADLLEPLLTVRPAYLEASFGEVRRAYGTFDRYLTKGLGLTRKQIATLRSELLVG
jgi:protein-tyrosine phosphatase